MTIRRPAADVVQFTRDSAERISRVVRESENAPLPGSPLTFAGPPPQFALGFPPVEMQPQRRVFRIATFTGAWSKETLKTVTLKYNTTTPNTFVARNLFAAIGESTATRNCAIAKEGTAWYLIAAEC